MTNIVFTCKKHQQHVISYLIRKSLRLLVYFLVSTMLLLPSTWTLTNANAQTDKDPAFQDSYWTDNNAISSSNTSTNEPVRKEVGPGEGTATLAVVLVNKARSDITAVKGYLNLPSGFNTIGVIPQDVLNNASDSSRYSVDSYNSIVKSGDTFTLYFDMNILKKAGVGWYNASLDLIYSKVLETGQITAKDIAIPFRITGKVILDVLSDNHHLIPGSSNMVKLTIKNKGTANASGVIVSVNGANSANNSPSGRNVSSSTENGVGETGAVSLINIGNSTFDLGIIPTNATAEINPILYPSNSAAETVQNLAIHISYGDAYGNIKSSDESVGLVISAKPPQSVLSVKPIISSDNQNSSIILKAGKIQNMGFTVVNEGKQPVADLVINLASQTDTVKILGNSKWTFEKLMPESELNLSSNVFASEDVIGKPVQFSAKIQYVSDEQSKTETITLGSYVDGEINLKLYDLDINIIGNRPNIVGNLLNEGNTVALFTTVEIIKSPISEEKSLVKQLPPQQYLGDVTENSPLPFSIPLTIENSTKAGTYPVYLRVSYKDNLRIPHELTMNGSVDFKPIYQTAHQGQSLFGIGNIVNDNTSNSSIIPLLIILAISIIIIATIVVLKKRRSKSKLSKILGSDRNSIKKEEGEEDIHSLLSGSNDRKNLND